MSDRKNLAASAFAAFSLLVFIISMFVNKDYFETLANESVVLYELRQLAAIALLFLIGAVFMLIIRRELSVQWSLLFAFPCGICLWCFVSFAELLIGIPYRFFPTLILIAAILLLCALPPSAAAHPAALRRSSFPMRRTHTHYAGGTEEKRMPLLPSAAEVSQAAPLLLIFAGIALLVSGGLVYSFVSYDSFFYFTNYGHTLAIVGNFRDIAGDNSFTLTNISQFLPILNAYTSFWGLDQCYQIQAMLAANVAAGFFYGIYRLALCGLSPREPSSRSFAAHGLSAQDFAAQGLSAQEPSALGSAQESGGAFSRLSVSARALLCGGIFTLLLVSSTSFITVASWVLANMYCMAYIFFLFLASFLISHFQTGRQEMTALLGMFCAALTLLRKDGIVFAAFFLIAFCTIELLPRKRLALLFLPSAAAEGAWLFYVRIILDARTEQGIYSAVSNNKNIFFVICIIMGSYLYLAIGHDILQWIQNRCVFLTEYVVLFAGMLLLFILSFLLKDADTIIDNVDFVIRNMFRYPSSWGISALFFGMLLALSLIKKPCLDYLHFLWIGYAFLNLISYCLVDSKWFWLNWDDSYNRVLLQIVPVFIFIMAVKILPLLQSDTPDHSSGS